jgi:anti-sigma factor RsiW
MRLWRRHRSGGDPLVCREFVELVTAYLEGTLPEAERVRFEAHLAECDGCTGYLEDMRRLVGSLHETPEPPPDPASEPWTNVRSWRDLHSRPSHSSPFYVQIRSAPTHRWWGEGLKRRVCPWLGGSR